MLKGVLGICCVVYIDDVIIYSKNKEQHILDIMRVVELLNNVNFQINLPKSKFFQKEVAFLGMIVSQG